MKKISPIKFKIEILPAKNVSTILYKVINTVPILEGTAILKNNSQIGSLIRERGFLLNNTSNILIM